MKRILAAIVGLALLPVLALASPASAAEPQEQCRDYWVDAFNVGLYTPDQVTDLVADAVDLGANALVVQIVRRFYCLCNDAFFPRTDASITLTASSDRGVKDADRAALAAAFRADVFTSSAQVPVMDWKTTPTTGLVAGTVTVRDGSLADQLEVIIHPIAGTPGPEKLIRTDGSGWFGAVNLALGTDRMHVVEPGAEGTAATVVGVKAALITQVRHRVDTA